MSDTQNKRVIVRIDPGEQEYIADSPVAALTEITRALAAIDGALVSSAQDATGARSMKFNTREGLVTFTISPAI